MLTLQPQEEGPRYASVFTWTYGVRRLCRVNRAERRGLSNPKKEVHKEEVAPTPTPLVLPACPAAGSHGDIL